jgi:hypothetical protein
MKSSLVFGQCVVAASLSALLAMGCGGDAGAAAPGVGSGGANASGGASSGGGGASGGSLATGGNAGSSAGTGGEAGTASGGAAGAGGSACPSSPSGYGCDPWSVFLYPSDGVVRSAETLRFQMHHDVDLEGNPGDETIAPGHDFAQTLTLGIALTPEVRKFLCTVFVPSPTGSAIDPSASDFLATVNPSVGASLLGTLPNDYVPHPSNVIDICGSGALEQISAPALVSSPTLPDIVLVLPLQPAPSGLVEGTEFSAWLARGILWVDEESELSPEVTATVIAVQ